MLTVVFVDRILSGFSVFSLLICISFFFNGIMLNFDTLKIQIQKFKVQS